jgi:hypothetical protein
MLIMAQMYKMESIMLIMAQMYKMETIMLIMAHMYNTRLCRRMFTFHLCVYSSAVCAVISLYDKSPLPSGGGAG